MPEMNYDYKEIAKIINKRFQERENRLERRPDSKFAHAFGLASDLNKCLGLLDDLKKVDNLDKYQRWFLKEVESIVPNLKYLFNDLNFDDEYGLRICLCSATIAFCAQFGLEDFEIFYNIYKEVLNSNKLNTLVLLGGQD